MFFVEEVILDLSNVSRREVAEAVDRQIRHQLLSADLQSYEDENRPFSDEELAEAPARIFCTPHPPHTAHRRRRRERGVNQHLDPLFSTAKVCLPGAPGIISDVDDMTRLRSQQIRPTRLGPRSVR